MEHKVEDIKVNFDDGKYVLTTRLDSGGFADVFRGKETESGLEVAIKVLKRDLGSNNQMVTRFLREAESMERMDHPNVLNVLRHGFDLQRKRYYYVMELIEDRQDPDEVICPKFPLENKIEIILQAINGYQYIHNLGLVHRDGKPDNLLVYFLNPNLVKEVEGQILTDRKNIRAKVSDLGIAKYLNDDSLVKLTKTGTAMGSPYYMSPEQVEGKTVDHRTDIYSLGATLYHYAVGIPPYDELDNANQIMAAKLRGKPPRDPCNLEIPLPLAKIIKKAMAKLPFQRYQTMSEFGEDLLRYSEGESPEKLKTSFYGASPRRAAPRRRHKSTNHQPKNNNMLYAGIGAVAAAVLGGVLLFGGSKKPVEPRPPKNNGRVVIVEDDPVKVNPDPVKPSALEEYLEFSKGIPELERNIDSFLNKGETDIAALTSLQENLNKTYPKVVEFQGKGVRQAGDMAKELFPYISKIAERKGLIKDYSEVKEEFQRLRSEIDNYSRNEDMKEIDLKRFTERIEETSIKVDRFRGKGLAIKEVTQFLPLESAKIVRLHEELKKQQENNPLKEAYSNFAQSTREKLGGEITEYIEEASYDTKKLGELLDNVKKVKTELRKYKGKVETTDLEKILEDQEKGLLQIKEFTSKIKSRRLLSDIKRYETYIERFLKKPNKIMTKRNIDRGEYYIKELKEHGEITKPLVARIQNYIARLKGEEPEKAAAIPKGCILYLPFDRKTLTQQGNIVIAKDMSGANNHGAVYGGAQPIQGIFGEALNFDGIDDLVSVTLPNFDTYSISFWFKKTYEWNNNSHGIGGLIGKDDGSDGFFIILGDYDLGKMKFGTNHGNIKTRKSVWEANIWHHIVAVQESPTRAYIYINGVENTMGDNGYRGHDNTKLNIGGRAHRKEYFNGAIDQVRVFNRALSKKEIESLYNIGAKNRTNQKANLDVF